jgi:VWFA-related protein
MRNAARRVLFALLALNFCFGPAVGAQPQAAGQSSGQAVTVPAPRASAPTPGAQNNPASVLRATSDLVRIDVEVTDRSGKPIRGLRADQFSVTDNGKLQKLALFSYSDIESIETASEEKAKPVVVPVDNPGPAGSASDAVGEQIRDRRLLVLYFDLTSMQTDDLLRARDAALKFIHQQMSKADLVAIVTYGVRLSVWADFTNDRATLEKAIARLAPNVSSQIADNLYAPAQNGEYDVQEYTGAAYTADETEFNVFNTDQKLAAIEGLANVLSAIPGRKSIIQFTSGITQTGEENRTQLRAATDAANRADVSIYAIDARGLFATAPGGDVTANAATGNSMFTGASVYHQTDQRQDSRDTLATLSTDTGGRAFFDLGDLSEAFPKIQQDNGGYYLLGYYLGADVKRDGRWRIIHVKVNAPGAHVRYRNGYYAPRDFKHLEKEDREQQLADAMHSDNPVVELPIAVETSLFRLNDEQVYVPIGAKLSSSALDWAEKHGRREAAFDFAAEVRAVPSGRAVAELRDTINVRLDAARFQQVSQSNLLYQGGVVLAPGTYHLKFLARENGSGKIGTFEQELVVPPAQPDRIAVSSVLLSSQLVPVEKSSEVQTKGQGIQAKIAKSPLEMEGQKIVPSVTRFFTQQQTLYVFFQAYYSAKLEKSSTPENSQGSMRFDSNILRAGLIFFRNGVQVNATPLLAPSEADPKTHTASFRISVPLAKLPTGRYTVQAVVIAAGTQHSAFGRSYFALQQASPGPSPAAVPPAAAPKPPSH